MVSKLRNLTALVKNGSKCTLWGMSSLEMDRDELVAFIGFLDELATSRQNKINELVEQSKGLSGDQK